MPFTIDLGKIYFGRSLIRYNGSQPTLEQPNITYPKQPSPATPNTFLNSGSPDSQRTSYLGTPVISDLTLEVYDNILNPTERFNIETVIIEVSQTKNIITTPIVGRNGTIKEYVADGDYQITIRGAVVEQYGFYPEKQVRELINILTAPKVIKPISDYLRLFDIHAIVVTGFTFAQREGYKNVQFFEINALSDQDNDIVDVV